MSTRMSPNQREVLSAISSITGRQEYLNSTSGALNVTITGGSVGGVQYADGSPRGTATGTLGMVDDGVNIQSMAGDTAGNARVVGNISSGVADSGDPVKVGAKYNLTQPTFTDGNRGDLQIDNRGNLRVMIQSGTNIVQIIPDNLDGVTPSSGSTRLAVVNRNTVFNGTNWDRQYANTTAALIAAGTTTTQTGITFTTFNAKRLMILLNIASGAGTVTLAINAVSASGYTTNLLTSTALVGVGTTALRIFDGATPSANLVANDTISRTVSVTATVVGSVTYGVDYILGV